MPMKNINLTSKLTDFEKKLIEIGDWVNYADEKY